MSNQKPLAVWILIAAACAAEYLAAMREVVPIRTNLEVRTWKEDRDDRLADELAERYRLTGPVGRLRRALEAPSPEPDR